MEYGIRQNLKRIACWVDSSYYPQLLVGSNSKKIKPSHNLKNFSRLQKPEFAAVQELKQHLDPLPNPPFFC